MTATLLLTLPAGATSSATAAPQSAAGSWAAFSDVIGDRLIRGNRAASVAVSMHGRPVFSGAFGTRAGDPADPTTTTDRFRLASISKVVTSITVLELVDGGDARRSTIPSAPASPRSPACNRATSCRRSRCGSCSRTLRASRTTADSSSVDSDRARRPRRTDWRDRSPINPGTTHDYSNLNYCLLEPADRRCHRPAYEAAVNEMLLAPLGITGMRLVRTIDPNPDEVVHQSGAGRTYMESLAGAGRLGRDPVGRRPHLRLARLDHRRMAAAAARARTPDDASARRALSRAERAPVRARGHRVAGRHVRAHRHGREHPHDARAPRRRADVVHPRQRGQPGLHGTPPRSVRRVPRDAGITIG